MAKVIFLHLSVILFTGGVSTRENPPCQGEPPGPGRPPQTRQTPWDQTPPGTRQTPPDQADPPGTRHPPRDQTPPLDQADPPRPGRPTGTRHPPRTRPPLDQTDPPPEADFSIRSTSGRYASYWNAFLFECFFLRNAIILLNYMVICYLID